MNKREAVEFWNDLFLYLDHGTELEEELDDRGLFHLLKRPPNADVERFLVAEFLIEWGEAMREDE